ncbi:MAG: hypothetical protein JKY55_16070 [Aliivibrio sp.]|uniref:hypothetical protein n=1 Tax=Aliivibrio sp. TaxID=1872443 RepID=UPI001A56A4FB|nr:hypothetical protein [Aliivibrio sp.]
MIIAKGGNDSNLPLILLIIERVQGIIFALLFNVQVVVMKLMWIKLVITLLVAVGSFAYIYMRVQSGNI